MVPKGLKKVDVDDLATGMYVARLDRDWLGTQFEVQGFYVTAETLSDLEVSCRYVYVDTRRFDHQIHRTGSLGGNAKYKQPKKTNRKNLRYQSDLEVFRLSDRYEDTIELHQEISDVRETLVNASARTKDLFDCVARSRTLDLHAKTMEVVNPLVESVIRNKNALAILLRIEAMDNYALKHAVSSCILAALTGRELGLHPDDIKVLSTGCFLADVGKIEIASELLIQPTPLDTQQRELIRKHVAEGCRIVKNCGVTDQDVIDIVATHHERYDGSGYPHGLTGNQIPVFGRIAGIVDSYDAMITPRPYAPAMSSFDAAQELSLAADCLFQKELVHAFLQTTGIFPVGALVELNTGEVGLVVAQNKAKRLRPKVMLLLDSDKHESYGLPMIDLRTDDSEYDHPNVWITRELPSNAYGLTPAEYFH